MTHWVAARHTPHRTTHCVTSPHAVHHATPCHTQPPTSLRLRRTSISIVCWAAPANPRLKLELQSAAVQPSQATGQLGWPATAGYSQLIATVLSPLLRF